MQYYNNLRLTLVTYLHFILLFVYFFHCLKKFYSPHNHKKGIYIKSIMGVHLSSIWSHRRRSLFEYWYAILHIFTLRSEALESNSKAQILTWCSQSAGDSSEIILPACVRNIYCGFLHSRIYGNSTCMSTKYLLQFLALEGP